MKFLKTVLLLLIATQAQAQTKAINVNRISASCTPNTSAYVSGDSVCGAMIFSKILASSMKGFILEATVADNQKLNMAYDIKCKGSAFAGTVADHAQFAPTNGELPLLTGVSLLTTDQYVYSANGETSVSGVRNYVYSETTNKDRGDLTCALIVRGTPTWSASTITLTLTVETLQ